MTETKVHQSQSRPWFLEDSKAKPKVKLSMGLIT
jgi:hypothetical protein